MKDYPVGEKSVLDEKTRLNKTPDISFVHASWNDHSPNTLGLFDLIIGNDLLYEQEHPEQLASFNIDDRAFTGKILCFTR